MRRIQHYLFQQTFPGEVFEDIRKQQHVRPSCDVALVLGRVFVFSLPAKARRRTGTFLWFLPIIGLFCFFLGFSFSLRSRDSNCSEGYVKTSSVALAAISARIGVVHKEIVQNQVLDEALHADVVVGCVLCFCGSSGVITYWRLFLPHVRMHPPFSFQDVCEQDV